MSLICESSPQQWCWSITGRRKTNQLIYRALGSVFASYILNLNFLFLNTKTIRGNKQEEFVSSYL